MAEQVKFKQATQAENAAVAGRYQLCDGIRCYTDTEIVIASVEALRDEKRKQRAIASGWYWQRVS